MIRTKPREDFHVLLTVFARVYSVVNLSFRLIRIRATATAVSGPPLRRLGCMYGQDGNSSMYKNCKMGPSTQIWVTISTKKQWACPM